MNYKKVLYEIGVWLVSRYEKSDPLYNRFHLLDGSAESTVKIGRRMRELVQRNYSVREWDKRRLTPEEAERLIEEQPGEAVRNVHWGVPKGSHFGATDIAPYPHCDPDVLHAPGKCWLCDQYPDMQYGRLSEKINFTGDTDNWKWPCPSTKRRSLEVIEQWPGNRASPYDEKE